MVKLRSVLFLAAFYVWCAIVMIGSLPVLVASERGSRGSIRLWARGVLVLLRVIAGIRYELRGQENVPATPCLIAAKHLSAWETIALLEILPNAAFVMKQELLRVPLYGRYARRVGMISVDRGKGAAALRQITERAEQELARGRQILIFPEGTRRPIGAPPDYKSGVGHFYKRFGVPCVPVAHNSGCHWPSGAVEKYPGTIVVSFLEPIPPGLAPKAFLADLQTAIEAETAELVAQDRTCGGPLTAS